MSPIVYSVSSETQLRLGSSGHLSFLTVLDEVVLIQTSWGSKQEGG